MGKITHHDMIIREASKDMLSMASIITPNLRARIGQIQRYLLKQGIKLCLLNPTHSLLQDAAMSNQDVTI